VPPKINIEKDSKMKKKMTLILLFSLGFTTEIAKADFTFGKTINLGPVFNSSSTDFPDCFSADGLEMYLSSRKAGGYGHNEDWGTPEHLGSPINTGNNDFTSYISTDGLELYFTTYNRSGGYGEYDMWMATRTAKNDPWEEPLNLGPVVNSPSQDTTPRICSDELELYFSSNRPDGYGSDDIWVSRRATKNDPWGEPENLGSTVNSPSSDWGHSISPDGLALYFSSNRSGGFGDDDLWVTTRPTTSDPWRPPFNLGPVVNSSYSDYAACISSDGYTLLFSSNRTDGFGEFDIWQVPIIPIVDLGGDGIVDSVDMCTMVDNWGTDNELCDIGPMPWGDGVVDVEDLKVLSEYLFTYPGAIAYWKLDETQGSIAYDNVSVYDGTLVGGPVWLPDSGIVEGALQLDGIDDYVRTDTVLNPANGVFSALIWIKDGAPGQVIVSQSDGANWLSADSSGGKLMTNLSRPPGGRTPPPPLVSEFVITDGDWHRVGFVWDGAYRVLYVDGAEVAKDTIPLSGLEIADGGLYIGTGSATQDGTFWSGLIDDVRIYDRVIRPK
jgi:hypothetical protein